MVDQAGKDYAQILQSADLEREVCPLITGLHITSNNQLHLQVNPLCTNIDDMLARLDEFETVLASVRERVFCNFVYRYIIYNCLGACRVQQHHGQSRVQHSQLRR